ncbi:MAG: hypothetical protein ACRD4F_15480 [Candidatus Angelobacter sp.]
MNNVPTLAPGETILSCTAPDVDDPGEYPRCVMCEAMAYRIVVVEGATTRRNFALCGVHFIRASLKIPELQTYMRAGKLG